MVHSKAGNQDLKKLNPFTVHKNCSKRQVVTQKFKSDKRLPGIARNKGLQKRRKILLQKYVGLFKNKNNQFIDRRIGERSFGVTVDEQIIARFKAERIKQFNKRSVFNLNKSVVLTHQGQTLTDIEKFQEISSDDENDEQYRTGTLKRKFVEYAHFSGGMLTKNNQDRESLIDELINESKKRKAERQYNKKETLELTEQLDEDWKTLGIIVTMNSKETTNGTNQDFINTQKRDKYDIVMHQLKLEPHGQAPQRIRTDEDIIQDKEQVKKLEKEQLKQLRESERIKYKNHKSVDDIDDGYLYLNDINTKKLTTQNNKLNISELTSVNDEIDVEHNEDINHRIEKHEVISEQFIAKKYKARRIPNNEFKPFVDIQSRNKEGEEILKVAKLSKSNSVVLENFITEISSEERQILDNASDLLPEIYSPACQNVSIKESVNKPDKSKELDLLSVLNVPDTYESFKSLLINHSAHQENIYDTLIKNIHLNSKPENKKDIFQLAKYMIQILNEGHVPWKLLMCHVLNFSFLKEYRREDCLKMLFDNLSTKVNNFSSSMPVASITAVKFLVWFILLFLKPQGIEVLLPISKPGLNFACKIISQADPLSPEHITTNFLNCYLLLEDAKTSSRVYTDAIVFLYKCIKVSLSKSIIHRKTNYDKSQGKIKLQQTSMCLQDSTAHDLKFHLIDMEEDEVHLGGIHVLYHSVVLLANFLKIYKKYPQAKMLFKCIHNISSQIKINNYPLLLKQKILELQALLQDLQSAPLPPLTNVVKQPKALRQYEPSIHNVTGNYRGQLLNEKQKEKDVLYKYKCEMKGAMREIRRDRIFLANIKLKEKSQNDKQRIKKVKDILTLAASQQAEMKIFKI